MRNELTAKFVVPIVVALVFCVAPIIASCGEEIDDMQSQAACGSYCDKAFECTGATPTDADEDACVDQCRNYIENECGNEHQAAANDQIEECVDMGCNDFYACMVFDANPQCYGFVGLQ